MIEAEGQEDADGEGGGGRPRTPSFVSVQGMRQCGDCHVIDISVTRH